MRPILWMAMIVFLANSCLLYANSSNPLDVAKIPEWRKGLPTGKFSKQLQLYGTCVELRESGERAIQSESKLILDGDASGNVYVSVIVQGKWQTHKVNLLSGKWHFLVKTKMPNSYGLIQGEIFSQKVQVRKSISATDIVSGFLTNCKYKANW